MGLLYGRFVAFVKKLELAFEDSRSIDIQTKPDRFGCEWSLVCSLS